MLYPAGYKAQRYTLDDTKHGLHASVYQNVHAKKIEGFSEALNHINTSHCTCRVQYTEATIYIIVSCKCLMICTFNRSLNLKAPEPPLSDEFLTHNSLVCQIKPVV